MSLVSRRASGLLIYGAQAKDERLGPARTHAHPAPGARRHATNRPHIMLGSAVPHTTHRLAKVAAQGPPVATPHMVDATERATTTRTPMASRGGSHTIARARIDRATRRGSRTRDLRRRRPPRTHARRRSLRLALRGARGAVDAALGACWPCEESPIAPAGRPAQATGSVGDQGGAKIDSSVDHAVAGTLESAGRERAPRDRVAFDAGFESRAAHCQDGIEAELSIAPEKSARK